MPNVTPTGAIITATLPGGTTQNVTEAVQVLYDLVIQSMDFSSGFLTIEDMMPMAALASFCGFVGAEVANEEMARLLRLKAAQKR